MPSTLTRFDAADGGLRNTELNRNLGLRPSILRNCGGLPISQLGCPMPLSYWHSCNAMFVELIFGWSCPSKVLQCCIGSITVFVSALHARWSRPNECSQYKNMYVPRSPLGLMLKPDLEVSSAATSLRLQHQSCSFVPDISSVADFIVTLMSNHITPKFRIHAMPYQHSPVSAMLTAQ